MPIIAVDKPQKSSGMPFPLGAAIGAGVSFLGGLFGNKSQSSNVDKQIAAQRQENALNREYNAREAEKNRMFQRSQIMDYRAYNSPANQAKLMQQAGYHPMSALGQFGSMDAGLSSGAQASSSGGISPVGYSPDNFAAAGSQIAQTRLLNAQAENVETDTKKKSEEVDNLKIQNYIQQATKDGLIEASGLSVELLRHNVKSAEHISEKLAAEAARWTERMNNIIEQGNVLVKNLKQQHSLLGLDVAFRQRTFNDSVRQFSAQAHISETNAQFCARMFLSQLANDRANREMLRSVASLNSWTEERGRGLYDRDAKLLDKQIELFDGDIKIKASENKALEVQIDANEDVAKINAYIDTFCNFLGGCLDAVNLKRLVFGGRGAKSSLNSSSTPNYGSPPHNQYY